MRRSKQFLGLYELRGKTPIPQLSTRAWAEWIEAARSTQERIVKQEEVDGAVVSTVFLGIDMEFIRGDDGHAPVLFETMVFRAGEGGDLEERYSTWEEAERGHEVVVRRLRRQLLP